MFFGVCVCVCVCIKCLVLFLFGFCILKYLYNTRLNSIKNTCQLTYITPNH